MKKRGLTASVSPLFFCITKAPFISGVQKSFSKRKTKPPFGVKRACGPAAARTPKGGLRSDDNHRFAHTSRICTAQSALRHCRQAAFTAKKRRWCCLTERDSDENQTRRVALSQRRETDQADKSPRSLCLIFSPHKKQPKTKYSIHRFINRCVYAKNMLLYSKQTRPTAPVFRGNPVVIEADGMDISDKNLRKLPIDRDMKKKDF